MCDEGAIRRIVREELKAAFTAMAEEARELDHYDADHIECVAIGVVAQTADRMAGRPLEPVAPISSCSCEHSSSRHTPRGCVVFTPGRGVCRCTSPVGGEL